MKEVLNRYILSHRLLRGEVELGYDSTGRLMFFHIRAELTEKGYDRLLGNMPVLESHVDFFAKKGFIIRKEPASLTFDVFYNAYGVKMDRKTAQAAWNRLSKAQQMRAVERIDAYRRFCHREGVRMRYPATYLNKETWTSEEF